MGADEYNANGLNRVVDDILQIILGLAQFPLHLGLLLEGTVRLGRPDRGDGGAGGRYSRLAGR